MKGIRLLFAVILAPFAFRAMAADINAGDTARAATRRDAATTLTSNRTASSITDQMTTGGAVSRATSTISAKSGTSTVRDRTTTAPRSGTVITDTNRTSISAATSATPAVSARTTISTVHPRTVLPTGTAGKSGTNTTTTRTGRASTRAPIAASTASRGVTRAATVPAPVSGGRNATRTKSSVTRAGASMTVARAASTTDGGATDHILAKNYTKCRTVYYECMDEFCANKDSQLRRCACSSRVNEFDGIKQKLSNVEDKMLTFNQRLLTVSMDKEDAAALSQATEGELAFQQQDTTQSKKILDSIADKLKTNTGSLNTDMSAISLSLDIDSAFDSVDSLMGASTTSKNGTALYSAALPICQEMAAEVCSDDELAIVTSGYQMSIEQDCNTVAKSYDTQITQAHSKILEGSALLDMSRLNTYQQRNSDDILTCKKKMLDALSDTSVCGTGLGKCLDTSGQYIDPTTGQAFLTKNLKNLATLITRPSGDEKWTGVAGNDTFVTFLNSKKKFLEPAMENCQDIADSVWNEFLEDALAQIKLAQDKKLEDMRQSCTTLTSQCLTDAAKTLADFDSRALSIFGVSADKTVRGMCSEITDACTALLDADPNSEWTQGINGINTDNTYETILSTCREVGRQCIIKTCKSVSGNFGLCEHIQTSINRKSIIRRDACWNDVLKCVSNAGNTAIDAIVSRLKNSGQIDTDGTFYSFLYGQNTSPKDNICNTECGTNTTSGTNTTKCNTCRIAERIWGNCAYSNNEEKAENPILQPSQDTLLYWFAQNTGTEKSPDSCRDTSCPIGHILALNNGAYGCFDSGSVTDGDNLYCPDEKAWMQIGNPHYCCQTQAKDDRGNCCKNGPSVETTIATSFHLVPSEDYTATNINICTKEETDEKAFMVAMNDDNKIICVTTTQDENKAISWERDPDSVGEKYDDIVCDGIYVAVKTEATIYTYTLKSEKGDEYIINHIPGQPGPYTGGPAFIDYSRKPNNQSDNATQDDDIPVGD